MGKKKVVEEVAKAAKEELLTPERVGALSAFSLTMSDYLKSGDHSDANRNAILDTMADVIEFLRR